MEKGWDKVGGRICLLGKANVCPEGGEAIPWGAKRETQLLALLLLERGNPVPRSTMRAELWEPRSDDGLLKPAISRLRTKMLEAGLPEIPKGTSTIRIALPTGWSVDCLEAEDALEEARGEREPPAAWAAVKQTIEALEREFLEGAFETPFLARARAEFAQLLHEARLLACDIAIREGADPKWQGQAIRTAAVAIHERPEEEGPYAAMVRLRIAAGQQREAIEYCEDFERENGLLESGEIFELKAKAQRHLAREENPPALLLLTLSRADEDSDFVGRDPLLEVLGDALDKLLGERFVGRALCGEKGVGKSRLAREFAVFAHQRGCTVISASAALKPSEEGVPCQPLITAIRNWVMHAEPSLRALVDPNALGELARFAPEIGRHLTLPEPREGQGLHQRLRSSAIEVIRDLANLQPTVLIVDDVHDLDEQSREALAVLCETQPANLMIVATAPTRGPGELNLRRHHVEPLDEDSAKSLAQSVLGADAGSKEVEELVRKADRNPYLIVHRTELDRIEADFVMPQIASLGPGGHEVLWLAAMMGSEFELDQLRRACGEGAHVNEALTLIEKSRLIAAGEGPGTFMFRHSLTREAILESIPAVEEARLSEQIVGALDTEKRTSVARYRALRDGELAAGREGAEAAIDAGDAASENANYPDALRYYREGLSLAGEGAHPNLVGRIQIGIAQSLWGQGEYREARECFLGASELEGLSPELRAVAVLGFGGKLGFGGARSDRQFIGMLSDALEDLPHKETGLRLRLQAALAAALAFSAEGPREQEEKQELIAGALKDLEETDDPGLEAEVLSDICWTAWNPDSDQERRDLAGRFVEVAEESRDIGLEIEARIFRIATSLQDGAIDSARADMRHCSELSHRAGLAHFKALVALLEGMDSLLRGERKRAEVFSGEALALGGREQNPAVFQLYGAQVLQVHVYLGRTDRIRAAAEALADAFPQMLAWRAGLGLIYAELGRHADAATQLEQVAHEEFTAVPRDLFWLVTLDHAARIAAAIGDRQCCAKLYELLAPHAGKIVVAGGAVAVYGALDRALGLAAMGDGRPEDAERHLRDAIEVNGRIGATAINTYVRVELAGVIASAGKTEEAAALARSARSEGQALGLTLTPRPEAIRYSEPAHERRLASLRERGASGGSLVLRRRIEGKTDAAIEESVPATRFLRALMPQTFKPQAACGWTGEIELEFEPPIGYRRSDRFWTIEVGTEKAKIRAQRATRARLSLKMAPSTFFKLIAGTLNPVEAWLDGHATVQGDPTVAARLVEMFSGPTPDL